MSYEELLVQARQVAASMSNDEKAHLQHQQLVCFASGNVALSWGALPGALEKARALVVKAVGPCPCGPCINWCTLLAARARGNA